MKPAIPLLVVAFLAACSDPTIVADAATNPDEARTDPGSVAGAINASYVLRRVNDRPLPAHSPTGAGEWDYGLPPLELIAATLTFRTDGTYSIVWMHRTVGDASAPVSRQECFGKYVRVDGSTVAFLASDGSTVSTATITPTGLVWRFSDLDTLAFEG